MSLGKKNSSNIVDLVSKENLLEKIENLKEKVDNQDRQIFEMKSLIQSGKGLSNILDLDGLLASLMAILRERYGVINSSVLLIDEDYSFPKKFFQLRAHHGLPKTFHSGLGQEDINLFKFPVADGLLWQIIKNGTAFSVQDSKGEPLFKEAWSRWGLDALLSELWCPLIKQGEVIGLITLGLDHGGEKISELEYGFINHLASIAATNIDSVIKYEKNRTVLRNVRVLYDVNQQLAEVNNFKKICKEGLRATVKGLRAQTGSLMLYNRDTGNYDVKVIWGEEIPQKLMSDINSGENANKYIKAGQGIAGKAIVDKQIIRVNGKENIDQFGDRPITCLISAPLVKGKEVIGLINIANKMKGEDELEYDPTGYFSEDDESLISSLVEQILVNFQKSQLYSDSITDKLTGLSNMGHYQTQSEHMFRDFKEKGEKYHLCIFDIDHFKKLNDTYGHKVGDLVLIEVASMLKNLAEKSNIASCFRYGGEEFCLLYKASDSKEVLLLAEEFRESLFKKKIAVDGHELKVTISGGLAKIHKKLNNASDLFKCADKALYRSKNEGRNKISVYEEEETL